MKSYALIAFLVFVAPAAAAFKTNKDYLYAATPQPTASRSVECSMEICFAIEGSNLINQRQFNLQKEFIAEVVRSVKTTSPRNDVRFAAVQYGVANDVISFLTADKSGFLDAVEKTTFSNTTASFVTGGIIFCHRDLFTTGVENGVIVLLGTGKRTFGGDPVKAAEIFNGKILAVGVGKSDGEALLEIVGGNGNRRRRFSLSRFNIRRVASQVLQSICDLKD